MAKRRRRGEKIGGSALLRSAPAFDLMLPRRSFLQTIEDLRTWHPAPVRPVGVFSRRDQRRIIEKPVKSAVPFKSPDAFPSLRLGFAVPAKVARCVRRKQRREVILAKGLGAKGARARRRRNVYSNMEC